VNTLKEVSAELSFNLLAVSGKLSTKAVPDGDKDDAAVALRVMAEHRALYDLFAIETSGGVLASVENLRKELQDQLRSLRADSLVAAPLDFAAGACRTCIGVIDRIADDGLRNVQGARLRVAGMTYPYDADKNLLGWADSMKTDDLVRCKGMGLSNLTPPSAQFAFVQALTVLRFRAGITAAALEQIAGSKAVPGDLRELVLEVRSSK
jgi:hypothetical protein